MRTKVINTIKQWYYFKRSHSQFFYEELLQIALKGMNYCGQGSYKESGETYVVGYIKKQLERSSHNKHRIFDVGANTGGYTQELINQFHTDCTIHCFEPSKYTFQKLQNNLSKYSNVILSNG